MLLLIKSVEIQNRAIEFNNWLVNASDNFDFPYISEAAGNFHGTGLFSIREHSSYHFLLVLCNVYID